jgi:hypothetical protein
MPKTLLGLYPQALSRFTSGKELQYPLNWRLTDIITIIIIMYFFTYLHFLRSYCYEIVGGGADLTSYVTGCQIGHMSRIDRTVSVGWTELQGFTFRIGTRIGAGNRRLGVLFPADADIFSLSPCLDRL